MSSINKFTIDTSGLPPADRFAAYAAAIEPLFEPFRPVGTPIHTNWSCTYWELGSIILCAYDLGPLGIRRRHRHIEASTENYVLLRILDGGTVRYESYDDRLVLRPREIHFFDISQPFELLQETRAPGRSVFVPHRLLGYEATRACHHTVLDPSEPATAIIAATIDSLFDNISSLSFADAERLGKGFAALVKQIVFQLEVDDRERSLARDQISNAIERHIDRNLRDPNLSVRKICRDLGMSRATVYRLMGSKGGVMKAVHDRRLLAAKSDLSVSQRTSGLIGTVAERYGYSYISHFSKQFKAKFGVSPSEVIGLNCGGSGAALLGNESNSKQCRSFGREAGRLSFVGALTTNPRG